MIKQLFVGFRPEGVCSRNCTNEDIGLGQDLRTLASQRYKRDIKGFPQNGIQQIAGPFGVVLKSTMGKKRLSLNKASTIASTSLPKSKRSVDVEIKKADAGISAIDFGTPQGISLLGK